MVQIDQGLAALVVSIVALAGVVWQTKKASRIAFILQDREQDFQQRFHVGTRKYDASQNREQALERFRSDLLELQRHSRENWFVLECMLAGMSEPSGTPYEQHFANLEYSVNYKSMQPDQIEYLDEPLKKAANKIYVMLRNANNEISYVLPRVKDRDAVEVCKSIVTTLRPKAEVFFTIWTVV